MSLAALTAVKQVHNQFLLGEFLHISAVKNAEELPRIMSSQFGLHLDEFLCIPAAGEQNTPRIIS